MVVECSAFVDVVSSGLSQGNRDCNHRINVSMDVDAYADAVRGLRASREVVANNRW